MVGHSWQHYLYVYIAMCLCVCWHIVTAQLGIVQSKFCTVFFVSFILFSRHLQSIFAWNLLYVSQVKAILTHLTHFVKFIFQMHT